MTRTALTARTFADYHALRLALPDLMIEALTHRSFVNESSQPETAHNERLEFLGDAVLNFITGDWLFRRFPDAQEGELTRLRAALVRKETLAGFARELRVGEVLRMGRGEEQSGGRERVNNLCGAFEAIIGALYVDQGVDVVRTFMDARLTNALQAILEDHLDRDARSNLQERAQAYYNLTPQYRTIATTGPEHAREFTVEVSVGTVVTASGVGRSKQAASQDAAQKALTLLDALATQ